MGRRQTSTGVKAMVTVLVVALVCWLPSRASAQAAAASHAKLEMIADPATVSGQTIWAGVLFHLDPGWHVYWENAGDSGTPPKIDWQVPSGYHVGAIRWPAPVRLGHGSVVDYGYENEVLLMAPIERTPAPQEKNGAQQRSTIAISADVKYVVCSDICIPGKAHPGVFLSLRDSGTSGPTAHWHEVFERTRAQLPKGAPAAWKISATSEKNDFVVSVVTGTVVKNATFFPLDPGEVENSARETFATTKGGLQLTLRKSEQLTKPVTTLRGLMVLGPQSAYQISVAVVAR